MSDKNENLEIAIEKYENGSYEQSFDYLNKLLETNENNPQVYLYMGLLSTVQNF